MRGASLNRLAGAVAVTAIVGALAAAALAAQPKGGGFYAGPFKNSKNYVVLFVKTNAQITKVYIQYRCKGKRVVATTPGSFDPVKVASNGDFVISYKAKIHANDINGKKVASGRARVVGHFVSRTKAVGTARVKSTKCPKAKQRFHAKGPQVEG